MIDKLGGLKLPPFKYAVSGPSLCPGHLYRVDSRSDEHRAEFFAVTALAAVTDLPAIGWDDAPGRVVIVGDVDQINNFIQPKIRLLAQAWGVALPHPGRMIFVGRSEPLREVGPAMMAVLWLKTILVILPPYVLAGMAISLALTRSPWPIGLVYGVDLIGAASGCLLVLALMTWVDGVSAMFAVGAIAAAASVCFRTALRRSGAADRLQGGWLVLRHPGLLTLLLAVLAAGNAAIQPRGLAPVLVKNGMSGLELSVPAAQRWNSFSRIRAEPVAIGAPAMWGPSAFMPAFEVAQMRLNIDGLAGTTMYQFDGDLAKLGFLRYDVTTLAYLIRNQGRSAVIGVGGGRDLLSAHLFGFADVTGVELNPIFINWLTERFRDFNHLADIPGTHFHVDEARSWFARTNERFDLIQMSLIDTWAATGAGAFSLSENGLYTVEGWKHFLDALTPDLGCTRFRAGTTRQMSAKPGGWLAWP